jgi:SanA protein
MKLETKKLIKKSILLSPLVIIILVLIMNFYVEQKTKDYIYDDVNNIPKNEVGLLLGTSKYLTSGMENLYYTYRIQAAVELYENKKIDIIIVSGDNSTKEYNEPVMMMNDLVEKGVKKEDIVLDYAGFRTLDSVVRSKEIFEQNKITIISQKFHNERAIFIAMIKDIDAIGYNAKDVNIRYGFKTQVREYLARVKMFFDIAVNKQPKFLGEKILIIK